MSLARATSKRPWLIATGLAVASLGMSCALSLARWPLPAVHDEFSNLLLADTLCHGRIANSTHPHWEHFESFHIIHLPTYASKYPPGPGAALALGQGLAGEPIVGVWVLTAASVVAGYWMFLGGFPPRWAAAGGALLLLHPGYQLQWGQSYWGGTLAFLGGALVFGGALRLAARCSSVDAVAMGTGAVVLAVTRPFEGLIFCLVVGGWLAWRYLRDGLPAPASRVALRMVLPLAAVLAAGLGALLLYHRAVTGDPMAFPYSVHQRTYGQAPLFVGQSPGEPPAYRHSVMQQFHGGWEREWAVPQQSLGGWLAAKRWALTIDGRFYFPGLFALLALVAVFAGGARGRRRLAAAGGIALATIALSLASTWNLPHYVAMIGPLLAWLPVAGLRRVDALARQTWGYRCAAGALIAGQGVLFALAAWGHAQSRPPAWVVERAAICDRLELMSGRDLVLVHYGVDHNVHQEWVYNGADLNAAPIVWARAMDPARDAALAAYYGDRTVWRLDPEARRLERVGGVPFAQDAR